jgi:hypothetical protein
MSKPKRVAKKTENLRKANTRPKKRGQRLLSSEGEESPHRTRGRTIKAPAVPSEEDAGPLLYNRADLVDDVEASGRLSSALGILSWSTWDMAPRPLEERVKDFVMAYPPSRPLRYSLGGMKRASHREWVERDGGAELNAFVPEAGCPGTIDRLLSRYGLKRKGIVAPDVPKATAKPQALATRERNNVLRMLSGEVDAEAAESENRLDGSATSSKPRG